MKRGGNEGTLKGVGVERKPNCPIRDDLGKLKDIGVHVVLTRKGDNIALSLKFQHKVGSGDWKKIWPIFDRIQCHLAYYGLLGSKGKFLNALCFQRASGYSWEELAHSINVTLAQCMRDSMAFVQGGRFKIEQIREDVNPSSRAKKIKQLLENTGTLRGRKRFERILKYLGTPKEEIDNEWEAAAYRFIFPTEPRKRKTVDGSRVQFVDGPIDRAKLIGCIKSEWKDYKSFLRKLHEEGFYPMEKII